MSRVLGPVVTKERTPWLSATWEGPEGLKDEHTEGQGKERPRWSEQHEQRHGGVGSVAFQPGCGICRTGGNES